MVPEGLPVWGSIIDDIWAPDHVNQSVDTAVGLTWLNRAETASMVRGVEPHHTKSVDVAYGEEIQG